nr:hypothetical protein [Micromonospora sp. DSM 115978]
MAALDELTVECEFYAAVHELAIVAWRTGRTVEALLSLADAVDPIPFHGSEMGNGVAES